MTTISIVAFRCFRIATTVVVAVITAAIRDCRVTTINGPFLFGIHAALTR